LQVSCNTPVWLLLIQWTTPHYKTITCIKIKHYRKICWTSTTCDLWTNAL